MVESYRLLHNKCNENGDSTNHISHALKLLNTYEDGRKWVIWIDSLTTIDLNPTIIQIEVVLKYVDLVLSLYVLDNFV